MSELPSGTTAQRVCNSTCPKTRRHVWSMGLKMTLHCRAIGMWDHTECFTTSDHRNVGSQGMLHNVRLSECGITGNASQCHTIGMWDHRGCFTTSDFRNVGPQGMLHNVRLSECGITGDASQRQTIGMWDVGHVSGHSDVGQE